MIKEWIAAAVAFALLVAAFLFAGRHGLIPTVNPERTLSSTNPDDGFGYYSGHAMHGNNHPAMYVAGGGQAESIVVLGAGFKARFPMSRFDEATAAYRKLIQQRGYHPFTPAAVPLTQHPILGSWELVADNACTEQETWEASGLAYNHSAREAATSRFEIAPQATAKGFYPVVDTIVATNGEPDCHGQRTPLGDQVLLFARFAGDGESFSICHAEDEDECFIKARRAHVAR